jgi:hypothetical protein
MRGWKPDGTEVDLYPEQAELVRRILDWHEDGTYAVLPPVGRGFGKTVVMSTVQEYIRRGGGRDGTVMPS